MHLTLYEEFLEFNFILKSKQIHILNRYNPQNFSLSIKLSSYNKMQRPIYDQLSENKMIYG